MRLPSFLDPQRAQRERDLAATAAAHRVELRALKDSLDVAQMTSAGLRDRVMIAEKRTDEAITRALIAETSLASERARVDKLIEQLAELKRDGFVIERSIPSQFKNDDSNTLPPRILRAIRDFAKPGSDEWDQLIEYATNALRNDPKSEQAVEEQIRRGWAEYIEEPPVLVEVLDEE